MAVNAYGSPIADISDSEKLDVDDTSTDTDSNYEDEGQASMVCFCKNTCSRKRSARFQGCPCKNAGLRCSTQCKCGTKKGTCKNREEIQVVHNNNPSAFIRHQEAVEAAQQEIESFIASLSSDEKDLLLVRLLSQGRGSLDFARNLLEDVRENDEPQDPEQNNHGRTAVPWCKCGVCEEMPTAEENVCCKLSTCVTSYQRFNNICIDREVLELAIRARSDIRADEPDYSTNSYRKAAYRQYVLWKYGKLGRGNRRVLPSCVVRAIRNAYRTPGEVFMGFKPS